MWTHWIDYWLSIIDYLKRQTRLRSSSYGVAGKLTTKTLRHEEFFDTDLHGIDTDLETEKLKCKTQNQNLKLKTNDYF